jgi:23S rRNA-/tRNA-specific pseudouridylate synthase
VIAEGDHAVDLCPTTCIGGAALVRLNESATGRIADRERLGVPVLFESEHEVVVIKPAGMATELTSDPKGVSVVSRIRAAVSSDVAPRLPHRLDRVTRGIVVVALSNAAIRFHNEQLRAGAWEKIYVARLRDAGSENAERLIGTHKVHLRTRGGRADVVRSGGKRAITEVLAVARAPDRSDEAHALLRLHTGRYHQIRATMAHLGVPLVDDWLYGLMPRREGGRFYLEHAALRFTPYGATRPRIIHLREDPNREAIAPALRAALDRLLEDWEGRNAEER